MTPDRNTPDAAGQLHELAHNLRWSWHEPSRALFRDLAGEAWEREHHNPAAVLDTLGAEGVEAALSRDDALRRRVAEAWSDLRAYLDAPAEYAGEARLPDRPLVAYFSAEFGITDALPIYSGGLGVLAGDHLKAASDLRLPLVGVGLLYREGYFTQRLNADDRQEEAFDAADFDRLPITPVLREDAAPALVAIPFPKRPVFARLWRAQVGRVPLFLLDTDIENNAAEDRAITARLYGGDAETRLRQELVLGVGGYRALEQLGIEPLAFHMNEGHSAFLGLERVRRTLEREGGDFGETARRLASGMVFTTHTPVAAGHDRFDPELMKKYFRTFARGMDLSLRQLLATGREDLTSEHEPFCMTVLALNLADHSNGVSRLHGGVSRRMWHGLWPGKELGDVPIGHVTNGVHLPSWVSPDIDALRRARGGLDDDPGAWSLDGVTDEALWSAHRAAKEGLIGFVRARLEQRMRRIGAPPEHADAVHAALDPDTLLIAFARRFATYKRATLLLSDRERLSRLLSHSERPVSIVYAGKAHPRDEGGKALIHELAALARDPEFRGRLLFLEGYDIEVARWLVRGADVWLNNPRRPMEASGTSGMKAAANGVPNASVLDGWWEEAWTAAEAAGVRVGWAITERREPVDAADEGRVDRLDAAALFELLEEDLVPLYYQRDADGLPRGWIEVMRASIEHVAPVYNTHRMVREYADRYYAPAAGLAPQRRMARAVGD